MKRWAPTETAPPLSSLVDWRVGTTDGGQYEVRIVLTDPAEARAWAQWLLSVNDDRSGPRGDNPSANQSEPADTGRKDWEAYLRYSQALRDMRLAVQRGAMDEAKRLADESLALEAQHPEFASSG